MTMMDMKTWIVSTLKTLGYNDHNNNTTGLEEEVHGNNKETIITSDEYLTCALTIAHSLADQLCPVDNTNLECGEDGKRRYNVSGDLQWSDLITVHFGDCSIRDADGKGNLKTPEEGEEEIGIFHPLPESGRSREDSFSEGILGRFHPVEEQDEQSFGEDRKLSSISTLTASTLPPHFSMNGQQEEQVNQVGVSKLSNTSIDYLNISHATIRMGEQINNNTSPRNESKMIYHLGLVFFELFSGGMVLLEDDPLANNNNLEDGRGMTALNLIQALGDDDDLFGGGLNANLTGESEPDDPNHSRKKPTSSTSKASESVEILKSMHLPVSLCNLIGNMIDCCTGDFTEDDTYSCLADVKVDLKCMMESPMVYLRGIDLDRATKFGLQMDDSTATFYGRDEEFSKLKQMYNRSISDKCEAAILCGVSGVGKSHLALKLLEYAKVRDESSGRKGCILLCGKFERRHQSLPFLSPIAMAFNEYCQWLSTDPILTEKVSSALKQALGKEVYSLSDFIPDLAKIIGQEPDDTSENKDCIFDEQNRLQYLISQFTTVIAQSHQAPLVLFIDNLQWADTFSVSLIKEMLLVFQSGPNDSGSQFFFLGCFAYEMDIDNQGYPYFVMEMFRSIKSFGIESTEIELNPFSKETVNIMLSKQLQLLPRLTRPLTEIIYHKTKGGPFFIRQLIIELSKEGLLRPSLSKYRWVWDEEKIQERQLPDGVVQFMQALLIRLPESTQSALCSLSCLGSLSEDNMIELEKEGNISLSTPLDYAAEEGFLIKKNQGYQFVDSRVQEAAYNLLKAHERCLHHFSYGLTLCSIAKRKKDEGLFMLGVGQINLGGPKAAASDEERLEVARYNCAAGMKAKSMSDFYCAYRFFDHGITFLKAKHWEEHYNLSLQLFNGAA